MKIEKAKTLKVGQIVYFPADRGDMAGYGHISHISDTVNRAHNGSEYLWVSVRKPNGQSAGVWPSNRLDKP